MSGLAIALDFAGLIERMTRKAAQLGIAGARTGALARRQPDRAWRSPDLLWPLFTKGTN